MSVREDTVVALQKAAEAANEAKAADIVAIDVSEPVAITDAFLLATASSPVKCWLLLRKWKRS